MKIISGWKTLKNGRKVYIGEKRGNPNGKKPSQTLFKHAKYKKYGEKISFSNPNEARKSVKELEKEFAGAKTKSKRLRIARVMQYSANRAYASAERGRLSQEEKQEMRQIGELYNKSAKKMWKQYRRM